MPGTNEVQSVAAFRRGQRPFVLPLWVEEQQVTAASQAYRNLYTFPMKTTLDLNDHLLADAKALAAQQRTSLTRLIEEGLQLRLRVEAAGPAKGRRRLPVFKGRGGLVAGVDPLSNKTLLEALDDDA